MKNIKKLLATFFAILTTINSLGQINTSANHITISICSRIIRLNKNKKMKARVKKLRKRLSKNYNTPILDGGSYGSTARTDGYECHHLISSHFCRHHKYCISRYRSPAVLIPKGLHELTGSHPKSGFMRCYFRWEKRFYKEWGLHGVIALGIIDLIRSIKKYEATIAPFKKAIPSYEISKVSPAKDALIQLQRISPWKIPFESRNFESPIGEKIYPAPICAARQLLFDNLND